LGKREPEPSLPCQSGPPARAGRRTAGPKIAEAAANVKQPKAPGTVRRIPGKIFFPSLASGRKTILSICWFENKADATTAWCAIAFFWLRLAHAVVYWLGLPFIRTLVFTLGWIVVVVLFFQVV
jgi:hypothetical protein